MFYVLESREGILKYLPKNAVGAEIGVAYGDYSEQILREAAPQRLHLIDPWRPLESDLFNSAAMLSQVSEWTVSGTSIIEPPEKAPWDLDYEALVAKFASAESVHVHRQYSYKAVREFPDEYFDFVYVDGDHRYEFVLRDLHDYAGKLKRGGLLFGHDFFEDAFARENHYGVIDAVNSFVKRSGFVLFMLTWEPFSTFCLTNDFSGFANQFLHNCLESEMHFIELPDSIAFHFHDKSYIRRSGVPRRIPSFG